jgi:mTERF domain-containing protein
MKENWEGRQPKAHDKYGSPEKSKSLHPRNKLGRSLTDLINMEREVEVLSI